MKYLKEFSTESDYLTYRDGADYLKPNVSLSDDNGDVYYNYPPPITYDYVDFGLPSGTKWATKNVGARKPSDAGFYFQWGDTKGYTANQVGIGNGKKKFADDWSDYKWGSDPNFTKYTFKTTLDLEDDAAHVNMGGDWHMPSSEQIRELVANTTSTWTTQDGVNGRLFTSKKDSSKSIFIPAAGEAWNGSINGSGTEADVWSSTINTVPDDGIGYFAYCLNIRVSDTSLFYRGRPFGNFARGIIETSGDANGHSYVDLGLPSNTLWATCNVGATKPSESGLYFQWGDTIGYTADQVGKDKQFNLDNYKFSINGSGYNFSKYGGMALQLEDDAAHVNMGGDWHIPNLYQIGELIENVDYKFTTLDGVGGIAFTSKNDSSKSIFFPTAGEALNGSIIKSGEGVAIWLDGLYSNDSGSIIGSDTSGNIINELQRYYGLPIRGVMNA